MLCVGLGRWVVVCLGVGFGCLNFGSSFFIYSAAHMQDDFNFCGTRNHNALSDPSANRRRPRSRHHDLMDKTALRVQDASFEHSLRLCNHTECTRRKLQHSRFLLTHAYSAPHISFTAQCKTTFLQTSRDHRGSCACPATTGVWTRLLYPARSPTKTHTRMQTQSQTGTPTCAYVFQTCACVYVQGMFVCACSRKVWMRMRSTGVCLCVFFRRFLYAGVCVRVYVSCLYVCMYVYVCTSRFWAFQVLSWTKNTVVSLTHSIRSVMRGFVVPHGFTRTRTEQRRFSGLRVFDWCLCLCVSGLFPLQHDS